MKTKKMILGLALIMFSTQIILGSYKNSDDVIRKTTCIAGNGQEYDISNIQPLKITPNYYNYGIARLNSVVEQKMK